jgi:membrane protein DedA with SNARE-associated domain
VSSPDDTGLPPVVADPALRRKTTFWVSIFGTLVVLGWVGDATAPALATSAPLLLVALSSKGRNVLLASRSVSYAPLVAVVIARRLVAVPVCHRLGSLRGPAILDWLDRKYPTMGESARMIEGWFSKSKALAVAAIPGNLTSMLAGVAGMPLLAVLLLSAIGVGIRVAITLALGEAFGGPLDGLLDFLRRNTIPVLVVTVGLSLVHLLRQKFGTNRQEPPTDDVEVPPRMGEP